MSELYSLPKGWEWRTINDVCNKVTDGAHKSPKTIESGKPYITVKDVNDDGIINFKDCKFISNEDFDLLVKGNCKPNKGDVLFSKDGTVGKVALVNYDIDFVVLSSLAILKPAENISSEYLKNYLLSPYFYNNAIKNKTGAAIKRIVLKTIKELSIPLPSLEEQKRIVAKLDILFAKIDKAIDLHQKNIDEADIFMASVLNDVFGELEEKYNKEKFDEIKTSNVIGLVRSVKEQSPSLQYQYVKMNNITNNNRFTFDNIINVDATDEEVRKFNLEKGDFLFNTRNSAELVGKSCIFDYDMKNILYNNNIMRVRFRDDISSYFVSYQFGCNYLKEQLENIKSATTNVAAIYYKTLKEIDVVIPPLQIQQKVVSYLDEISNKMEKIKNLQKEKMQSLKALKASILDKAFKGEL
ncbi:restriction endonuclease subunit S [Arcobacter porcinus]|uniref:Type I restriction/modification system, specificity subunit n=1 Tax=Arcobacter porcinus TaxID=1935204 RepID=A0A1C0AYR4_9BACT|nr:restriction endonuclease subunit S [Arcobacter porcinus]OCL94408.1 Type-1 restriction enzyme EcoKI specificity protein [Aliarcobacter thereius]OCL83556.1 Type-1 restriction enzyme EcoKI specificity protein [Arcobacter porcinus]OCL83775.1 Type-1 restriction enzyme EcoKI specificity protein [Arcobacter porcinus]OCL92768.1 Type-1 restriction enzyme EcoKI specificity protein [Arcobacter porcinus]QEP41245.1 type I restriction/modification system, specificity subunit [Arcobacter porcinus]